MLHVYRGIYNGVHPLNEGGSISNNLFEMNSIHKHIIIDIALYTSNIFLKIMM